MANKNGNELNDSTTSTVYELPIHTAIMNTPSNRMNESLNSVSSAGSSIVITDSLTAMEDFPGFASGDPESDNVSDPFQAVFYHIMPLQDSTNILFYKEAIFNSVLTVLSKQFRFPSEETKKFQLKTHLDQRKCILAIDKTVMSVCASGPGHMSWKEKVFSKLGANLFRAFVKENGSLLNTNIVNETVSSQDSTHFQGDNETIINETAEEPETEPPAGAVSSQQPRQVTDLTCLQDSPVIRQISTLMDMISNLQGQITTLDKSMIWFNKLQSSLHSELWIRLVSVHQP